MLITECDSMQRACGYRLASQIIFNEIVLPSGPFHWKDAMSAKFQDLVCNPVQVAGKVLNIAPKQERKFS
jgi:hypothetical protein